MAIKICFDRMGLQGVWDVIPCMIILDEREKKVLLYTRIHGLKSDLRGCFWLFEEIVIRTPVISLVCVSSYCAFACIKSSHIYAITISFY